MSLSALLGALAREANSAAIMVEEAGVSRVGYCARKAELFRLAADGFAQAAALETESDAARQMWQHRATKAAAAAASWSSYADHWLKHEAAAFEPA